MLCNKSKEQTHKLTNYSKNVLMVFISLNLNLFGYSVIVKYTYLGYYTDGEAFHK